MTQTFANAEITQLLVEKPKRGGGRPRILTDDDRRERRRTKSAKQRADNPERIREITRNSMKRASDAKAIAEGREPGKKGRPATPITAAEKRAKQNARVKRYYASNIEVCREIGSRAARTRRARIRGSSGTHTAADIADLMEKQKGKCTWCLQRFGKVKPHVDHRLPLALGGSNDKGNLQLLHPTCNLMKLATHPLDHGLRSGLLCW